MSVRYFLGVIDETAKVYLAETVEGGYVLAKAEEVDVDAARGRAVGRARIVHEADVFSVIDGFGDPICTVEDRAQAEDALQSIGYRSIECTSRLYRYAGTHGCTAHWLLSSCNYDAAGLLDLKGGRASDPIR
ncbi:hypothetical protein LNAOJCKE_5676 [Methylorubrum aminovorans]|uniref:Uncharacterized protein n=1 Tax=Methylorubrum aminovorans TaxID=269069 RepID=A0ABQ4UN39_9HYPH|nr:hypothetical protein [Methylorubrum aminovorans]GJE68433.1 hypothetical protein LNAOJCKE_5676 [Methylorubrum aminovorans]